MQHDAESRRRERYGEENERRPDEIEQGGNERDAAEDLIVKEDDTQAGRAAQPSIEPALAGQRHGAVFERHVTHIKRLAHRDKPDDQEPVQLACRRQEEWLRHAHNVPQQLLQGEVSAVEHGGLAGQVGSGQRDAELSRPLGIGKRSDHQSQLNPI